MSSDVIITAQGLSKCYQIYDNPRDRLKQFVVPWLRHAMGQPSHRYYREFWALQDVSFELRRGETIGIIGRNGSGKSTLLQLVCQTLTPTSGVLETKGRIAALLELGSGFNPEFSGRENVYMNATLLGLSQHEIDARMDQILAFAEIGEFIDQPVKTYSSGMYVRLAFAVIAHVDADILVIDEALAVGDAFFTQKCMRFLRSFMQNGTVLFVSHDTSAVLGLCQRAIWLDRGKVICDGSPKKVASAYLKALFEGQQGDSGLEDAEADEADEDGPEHAILLDVPRDMRQDLINHSQLRNDLEFFEFSPSAEGFGKGGALIQAAYLQDANGHRLNWIVGGEEVILCIQARVQEDKFLAKPILGFYIKDRLGQTLFGDNTYLACRDALQPAPSGSQISARFFFRMPVLPNGDYTVGVAIADGTQHDHIQHHWIHDALAFKSHSSSQSHGLVGIPMSQISLEVNA